MNWMVFSNVFTQNRVELQRRLLKIGCVYIKRTKVKLIMQKITKCIDYDISYQSIIILLWTMKILIMYVVSCVCVCVYLCVYTSHRHISNFELISDQESWYKASLGKCYWLQIMIVHIGAMKISIWVYVWYFQVHSPFHQSGTGDI